jgi:exosortase K
MRLRLAVLGVAALVAWGLKQHYADARAEDLAWILGPTSLLTGAVTGTTFVPLPGEGYFSRERLFVIAKACAGVNFMVAALVMLVVARLRRADSLTSAARVLVTSLLASYAAAVAVNATRIVVALWLAAHPQVLSGFSPGDIHRVEGVAVYFGGLVLLYELARRLDGVASGADASTSQPRSRIARGFRRSAPALASYYAVTLAIPIAGGAWSDAFLEYALTVLLIPPLIYLAVAAAGWVGRSLNAFRVLNFQVPSSRTSVSS